MRLACNGLPVYFDTKATIITPSPLLASVVAQQFSAYQLERGLESWERAAIYSIEAWLAASWQEVRYNAVDIPLLLSPPQERVLWQHVIEEQHPDLFDLHALARMARSSAQLLAEWHIPAEGDLWKDHQDAQAFQVWHKRFRRKCREEGWIIRSDLWELVPKWIIAGHCRPDPAVLAGFTIITPALEHLRHALGDRAATEPPSLRAPRQLVPAKSCADFSREIELAARWARAIFEQQASCSIGIFIPDLSSHRSLIQRTFEQVFYPSAMLRSGDRNGSIFHITGSPPKQHPLIASALLLLELAHPRIHHADASAILRSPFITGAATERSARALADLRLRRLREPEISLSQMAWATKECALLTRVWPAIRRVVRNGSNHLELAAWSEFIGDLLEAVGWPGDAELGLQEQELIEAWKNALSVLRLCRFWMLQMHPVSSSIAHFSRASLMRPGPQLSTYLRLFR
jgi:ATP-dependent helicase/nuclease subunit B